MATVVRPKEVEERLARISAEEEGESLFSRYYLLASAIITGLALVLGWLLGRLGVISNEVEVGFYIVAYIAGGSYPAVQSIKDLARLHVQIDLLMVTAAIGAAIIGHWTEGAILLFLFSTSNALEHYALGRTKRAVRALMDITPEQALVERDGMQRMVHVRELEIGDVVIVRPGERIAADGRIIGGESGIDQSAITGESMPVVKRYGDDVFTGTINGHGALRISVTRLAHESTLAKIVEIVRAAQSDKSRQQRFADRFEGTYAVGVIAFSALYFAFLTLGLSFEPADAFYRAMVLLVVASPCALVISTPASTLSALANSARQGILIKGAAQLEDIGAIKVIAFDKTGTLTVGEPRLTALEPAPGVDETELLTIAASAERMSEHPLAEAIVNAARMRELPLLESHDLRAITGKGIEATVEGRTVLIGNAKLLADYGVQADAGMSQVAASLQEDGMTVSYVSAAQVDGPVRLLGVIAVADTLRPAAAGTVARLKELGIEKTLMLSGDNERSANAIARHVGLDEVYASLLPAEKLDKIEELKAEYGEVVMVGDGVNDAPALATASIGVAMGAAGSDAALETADIVLMADDLTKLPYVVELSRKTRRVIRQNLGFSLAVIVVLVTATLIGATNLTVGVIGHEGSTVIVVLNGLRLLRRLPTERPAALRAESLAPATAD